MHSVFVLRRRVSCAVAALIAVAGLVMVMSLRTSAHGSPAYPPTTPCSSMSAGGAGGSSAGSAASTCSPSHGIEPAATHRSSVPAANSGDGEQNNHGTDNGTAVTGFAALTATVIAVLLLGGGVLFLTVGRRRQS